MSHSSTCKIRYLRDDGLRAARHQDVAVPARTSSTDRCFLDVFCKNGCVMAMDDLKGACCCSEVSLGTYRSVPKVGKVRGRFPSDMPKTHAARHKGTGTSR